MTRAENACALRGLPAGGTAFAQIPAWQSGTPHPVPVGRAQLPFVLRLAVSVPLSDVMLRVTIRNSSSEIRVHLEGRLAGPWVREVELCWQMAQAAALDRAMTIDLREVDFVDPAGERLLAAMHEQGADLLATGLMTKDLVSRITGEADEMPETPALPPRRLRSR